MLGGHPPPELHLLKTLTPQQVVCHSTTNGLDTTLPVPLSGALDTVAKLQDPGAFHSGLPLRNKTCPPAAVITVAEVPQLSAPLAEGHRPSAPRHVPSP